MDREEFKELEKVSDKPTRCKVMTATERDILGCEDLICETHTLIKDLSLLVVRLSDRIEMLNHPVYLYDPEKKDLKKIESKDEP